MLIITTLTIPSGITLQVEGQRCNLHPKTEISYHIIRKILARKRGRNGIKEGSSPGRCAKGIKCQMTSIEVRDRRCVRSTTMRRDHSWLTLLFYPLYLGIFLIFFSFSESLMVHSLSLSPFFSDGRRGSGRKKKKWEQSSGEITLITEAIPNHIEANLSFSLKIDSTILIEHTTRYLIFIAKLIMEDRRIYGASPPNQTTTKPFVA